VNDKITTYAEAQKLYLQEINYRMALEIVLKEILSDHIDNPSVPKQ
jgi:hypothetical protein